MSLALHGIGVSKGIAIGKVHIIHHDPLEITEYCIPLLHLESEVARFENAVSLARLQLLNIRDRIPKNSTVDIAAFIEAHLLMLEARGEARYTGASKTGERRTSRPNQVVREPK